MTLRPFYVLAAFAVAVLTAAAPAAAQTPATNAERLGGLAADCAVRVLESPVAITLSSPASHPYVGSSSVQALQEGGWTVYAERSEQRPTLSLIVLQAGTRYERAGRGSLERRVALTLRTTVTDPDGAIRQDEVCEESASDVVPRDALALIENQAWPSTQGEVPPGGWRSRYLQPVVITAATAVGTLLFFSLRSRRSNDGS